MSNAAPPTGGNGNAPTEPMHGSTAPLDPRQQRRQQLVQGSQRGRLPPWQGRPQGQGAGPQAGQPRVTTFRGQQPGETPIFVHRKHPFYLFFPAWPAVLSLAGLMVLFLVHSNNSRVAALFFILQVLLGIAFIIFLIKWLVADLNNWLFNLYVLTDRRLMAAAGFFTPNRQEAPLDRIQQVQIDRNNLFEYFFDFGDVIIVTAGSLGDLNFAGIARPNQIADQIRETEQRFVSSGRAAQQMIEPKHPAVKRVLDEVAKPIAVAPPQGVPHRTFGGFLGRSLQITYLNDEVVLDYIFRHWWVLVRREVFPALLLIGSVAASGALAAFFHTALWVVPLMGVLSGVVWGILVYLNYADDVFILTNQRIIDVDRFLFIFFEGRKQAEYTRIQDVRVTVDTIIARLFNFGDIISETAGRLPNIEMSDIPNPFVVQDKIFSLINAVKERDAVAASNRQRLEDRRLIAATMNELLIDVPDVRQLFMLDAAERLRQAGLKLVVESERRVLGVPPGVVVAQTPNAGTTALRDSEVQVVLSGR
jgi:uncharacterized membrane protein YdbT with pleckstrin-like domain